ncbi:uncharacterized protein LOC144439038 [Glandiceps talaboti]
MCTAFVKMPSIRRNRSCSSSASMSLLAQSLFGFIASGDISAVVHLLERHATVDERDENGQTALMFAADRGETSIASELILRGADINATDEDNWTALLCAARQGQLNIVKKLLDSGADIEHKDIGEWTALMWASYKGHTNTARYLLDNDANPNVQAQHGMMPIVWAAGRGHWEIVELLLEKGAKVDSADKHGTTCLVWAARKGHLRCVQILLDAYANVDIAGMRSWTPLIAATKGGYLNCVEEILERHPNSNAVDMDGHTALSIAAKEGHVAIVNALLHSGAYVNLQDRNDDSILISAVKGGHTDVVRLLINKYADVDVIGAERKTALHWAVEKGNLDMTSAILECGPDTEIYNKDHETPLIKAVRNRNTKMVRLLLDKGAKVSALDKKGDTPLHIAIRGRHKSIAELLLRNPKDGRLLYRQNRAGETPYNIDCTHHKSILTQIFGAKSFTATDNEQSLLSDLYSSSLADILSEPTLSPPITVGLFARWGSGKSFLLKKLQDEMKLFAEQDVDPVYSLSWLSVNIIIMLGLIVALVLSLTVGYVIGSVSGITTTAMLMIFLVTIHFVSKKKKRGALHVVSSVMARQFGYLQLLLKVCFCNPPTLPSSTTRALPIRFLFTDYSRLTSVGGETSLARMIGTLCDAAEAEFGFLVTRLYRVFKIKVEKGSHSGYFRRVCCIPVFIIVGVVLICLIIGVILIGVNKGITQDRATNGVLIALVSIIGVAVLINIKTLGQILYCLVRSQKKRVLRAAKNLDRLRLEGFMRVLKREVELIAEMVKCIDAYSMMQTRLVIVVDGLDSCEQAKVLQVLETVNILFSGYQSPFITVLAIDPHILIKAIELNFDNVFRDSNISGHDYLKNIVQLPFYLESGIRKIQIDSDDEMDHDDVLGHIPNHVGETVPLSRATSRHSSHTSLHLHLRQPDRSDAARKLLKERTFSRQVSTMFDLSKILAKSDQFGDLNPRSMRRLLNIVSITGRLLRAHNIDFNWNNLAAWINMTEQWPYRTSWMIYYIEENIKSLEDHTSLKTIFDRIVADVPVSREIEPLLELDSSGRGFYMYLTRGPSVLRISDLKKFLPCTVNLDPWLRRMISDLHQAHDSSTLLSNPYTPGGGGGGGGGGNVISPRGSWYGGPYNSNFTRGGWKRMSFPGPGGAHLSGYSAGQPLIGNELLSPTSDGGTDGMSIKDVCDRLLSLEGIDQHMIAKYQAKVAENNINGHVLLQCDLDELKRVLGMTFGDWQLFRAMVLRLREQETMRCGDFCDANLVTTPQIMQDVDEVEDGHLQVPGPDSFLNLSYEELRTIGGAMANMAATRASPKLDESPTANPPDGPFSPGRGGYGDPALENSSRNANHHHVNVQIERLQCKTIGGKPYHKEEPKKKHPGKSVVLKGVFDEPDTMELDTIIVHNDGNQSAKDSLVAKQVKEENHLDSHSREKKKPDHENENNSNSATTGKGRGRFTKPGGKASSHYTMSYVSDFSSMESLQNAHDKSDLSDRVKENHNDNQFLAELKKLKNKMSFSQESLNKKAEDADNEMSPLLTPVESRKTKQKSKNRPKFERSTESLDFETEEIPMIDGNGEIDSRHSSSSREGDGQQEDEDGISNRRDVMAQDANYEDLHISENEMPSNINSNSCITTRLKLPSSDSKYSSAERKGKEVDKLFRFLNSSQESIPCSSSRGCEQEGIQNGASSPTLENKIQIAEIVEDMEQEFRQSRERSSSIDATVGSNSERGGSVGSLSQVQSQDELEKEDMPSETKINHNTSSANNNHGKKADMPSKESKFEEQKLYNSAPTSPSNLEAKDRRRIFNTTQSSSVQGFPGEQEAAAEAKRRPPLRRSASASSPYRHSDTSAMSFYGSQRPKLKTLEESFEEYISVTTTAKKKQQLRERLTTDSKPFFLFNSPFWRNESSGRDSVTRARDNPKRRSAPPGSVQSQSFALSMHDWYIEAKPSSPEDKEIEQITSQMTSTPVKDGSPPRQETPC